MYQRILVATDGSTLSKKAVASAISLAATCGATLVAVKVVLRSKWCPAIRKPTLRAASH